MTIEPVAFFHSPLKDKFGIPRQAGLAKNLGGYVQFTKDYAREEALKGLEDFSHIWLIWQFSLNSEAAAGLTIRPPRLGGNRSVGVFASRSPFRPNPLGLSAVKIEKIVASEGLIYVSGADLADGTPIFDVKPYIPYADSIPDAAEGFTAKPWDKLKVIIPRRIALDAIEGGLLSEEELKTVSDLLSLDPRPQYQKDPQRIYGLSFKDLDIRFKVDEDQLEVTQIILML